MWLVNVETKTPQGLNEWNFCFEVGTPGGALAEALDSIPPEEEVVEVNMCKGDADD